LGDHVRSNVGVATHDFPFVFRQRTWFVENVIPNSNLAEIVERSGSANQFALSITKFEALAQLTGELGNPDRVRLGVTVSCVKRLRRKVKRLILEFALALRIGDIASDCKDKPKEPGRHDVSD
jgi:hypothetical protein